MTFDPMHVPIASPGSHWWRVGTRVARLNGGKSPGRVVGCYSTSLTPKGYAISPARIAGVLALVLFCFEAQAQQVPRQGDFITINSTVLNAILEAHAEYTQSDPDIGCLDLILSRREAGKFLVSFMPDNRNKTNEPEGNYLCNSSVTYEFSDDW